MLRYVYYCIVYMLKHNREKSLYLVTYLLKYFEIQIFRVYLFKIKSLSLESKVCTMIKRSKSLFKSKHQQIIYLCEKYDKIALSTDHEKIRRFLIQVTSWGFRLKGFFAFYQNVHCKKDS